MVSYTEEYYTDLWQTIKQTPRLSSPQWFHHPIRHRWQQVEIYHQLSASSVWKTSFAAWLGLYDTMACMYIRCGSAAEALSPKAHPVLLAHGCQASYLVHRHHDVIYRIMHLHRGPSQNWTFLLLACTSIEHSRVRVLLCTCQDVANQLCKVSMYAFNKGSIMLVSSGGRANIGLCLMALVSVSVSAAGELLRSQ